MLRSLCCLVQLNGGKLNFPLEISPDVLSVTSNGPFKEQLLQQRVATSSAVVTLWAI